MRKISKVLGGISLLIVLFSIPVQAQNNKVKVIINGAGIDIDNDSIILKENRTFISMDKLAEKLALQIEYVDETKVNISKDDIDIKLELDSKKVNINGKELELDVKPFEKDKNIFIPLRFIVENIGREVKWDKIDYDDGKYIEALFGRDFQYYPETLDSYKKIFDEGQKSLGSFKKIYENHEFVKDDKGNYKEEIKIESEFDRDSNLIRYHIKKYDYNLRENKIGQDEALKLANDFVKKHVAQDIKVEKIPNLYPSLYEEDKHETYGDVNGKYVVTVDLEHGIVEYFNLQD